MSTHIVKPDPVVDAADPDAFPTAMLEQVTFNVLVGNGDSHAKNYSYFIDADARMRPAPVDRAGAHVHDAVATIDDDPAAVRDALLTRVLTVSATGPTPIPRARPAL